MGSPTGYSLSGYGEMINCEPRMSAYEAALRAAVTPGCTVIDIGAGPGVFSILACQFGAGSVIVIEPHDSVELLRTAAIANGVDDRITVFQGISTDYVGPRADVIISDLRGCLPLFELHIPSIIDARDRLLTQGGQLIPARDRLHVALVHDPDFYLPCIEPWLRNRFGLDLSSGHRVAVNSWSKVTLRAAALLSPPKGLLTLDYTTITNPDIAVEIVLEPDRSGTAHGFLVWFDAELAPGIGFSNAPGEADTLYGQTFFPFEQPVELSPGDRTEITLKANLINGSYVWSWTTKVWRPSSAEPEATYRQSTFLSKILSPSKLARRSSRFVPAAQRAHEIDLRCLSLFDGEKTLGDIADALATEFPDAFNSVVAALSHATELADRYPQAEALPDPQEAGILLKDDLQ